MTDMEPIRLTLELACSAEHAFTVWTSKIDSWWPADHTVSGDPQSVVLEPFVGGRIYETTDDGSQHEWGEIVEWEPPRRFAYLWHLRSRREDATDVDVRFLEVDESTSRVDIVHSGWERLGAEAQTWRDRNNGGWSTLLPHFVEAAIA
jgi:uncharacterized protein YndB with AHSA1/START domain